ncbi:unnamed protein product [Amoebophrya sp. A25]|nr:unnamed protein product [Amoebophrya sp. A25]|eukprot:GSA25T00020342001.1
MSAFRPWGSSTSLVLPPVSLRSYPVRRIVHLEVGESTESMHLRNIYKRGGATSLQGEL